MSKLIDELSSFPNGLFQFPITPSAASLPLGELEWKEFEKLTYRLLNTVSSVDDAHLYGKPGQRQEGIDILALQRESSKRIVCQCKRYKNLDSGDIVKVVQKFKEHKWFGQCDELILSTSADVTDRSLQDEINIQRQILDKGNIKFTIWGRDKLNELLREQPHIVIDFFSDVWAQHFCGETRLREIGKRLDRNRAIEYRKQLRTHYENLFEDQDGGLYPSSAFAAAHVPLQERFVLPDVLILENYHGKVATSRDQEHRGQFPSSNSDQGHIRSNQELENRENISMTQVERRMPADRWLEGARRGILLGPAGIGKSSFLRQLTLELLSDAETSFIQGWDKNETLPLWLPFGYYSAWKAKHEFTDVSLKAIIRDLLSPLANHGSIIDIVTDALEDRRLILIVDGLDEHPDTLKARMALDDLVVYANSNDLRAFFSSRPEGFRKLQMNERNWQITEIAPLNEDQIRELARKWFSNLETYLKRSDFPASEATNHANSFMSELERHPASSDLAKTPLLLKVLLVVQVESGALPEERQEALDKLVTILLKDHPNRRLVAAKAASIGLPVNEAKFRKLLNHLAFNIHMSEESTAWQRDRVTAWLETELANPDTTSFTRERAETCAQQLTAVSEETFGILVSKGSGQLGFLHRSIQEHMAAAYLATLKLDAQRNFIETSKTMPQHREVIVGLFYFLIREDDADQLAHILLPQDPIADRPGTELYLEAVLLGRHCSGKVARDAVSVATKQIQFSSDMRHKKKLLRVLISSMNYSEVERAVVPILTNWYPSRFAYLSSRLELLKKAEPTPEVLDCLMINLHSDDLSTRSSASKVVVELFNDKSCVADRIFYHIQHCEDEEVLASLLETGFSGWPADLRWRDWWKHGLFSSSGALLYIACRLAFESGDRSEDLLRSLWKLSRVNQHNIYTRSQELGRMLVPFLDFNGVRSEVLNSISNGKRVLDRDVCFIALVNERPLNDKTVEILIRSFENERFPLNAGAMENPYGWLNEPTPIDNPSLVEAIKKWAFDKEHLTENALYNLARISPDEQLKNFLLEKLKVEQLAGVQWIVAALINNWGMKDSSVSHCLKTFCDREDAAYWASGFFKKILGPEEARQALQQALDLHGISYLSRIAFPLQELLDSDDRLSFAENWLSRTLDYKAQGWDDPLGSIIESCCDVPAVRTAALRIVETDGEHQDSILAGFTKDQEILRLVLPRLSEIDESLRLELGEQFGRQSSPIEHVLDSLVKWVLESSPQAASAGAVSLVQQSYRATNEDLPLKMEELLPLLRASGPGFEAKRQGAFASLIAAGEIERWATQRSQEELQTTVTGLTWNSLGNDNFPLAKQMALHWDELIASFGPFPWADKLFRQDDDCPINLIGGVADLYPSARKGYLEFLRASDPPVTNRAAISFVERTLGKSSLLCSMCESAMFQSTNTSQDKAYAERSFLRWFGPEDGIAQTFEDRLKANHFESSSLVSLARLGKGSAILSETHKFWTANKVRNIDWAAWIAFKSHGTTPEEFWEFLLDLITERTYVPDFIFLLYGDLLRLRVERDEEVRARLFEGLIEAQTFSGMITLASLLRGGPKGEAVAEWAKSKLTTQYPMFVPAFGKVLTEARFERFDTFLESIAKGF